jgi:signal transduction histidine kinase
MSGVLVIALQLAQQRLDTDAREARELVGQALDETRGAVEDLRDLAAALHPAVLTHRGLQAAVETLTARVPVPVTFHVVGDRFDPSVEAAA